MNFNRSIMTHQEMAAELNEISMKVTKLTAERDALAERVRRYEAFVAAYDEWNGDELLAWKLEAARAAIDAQQQTTTTVTPPAPQEVTP